MRGVKTRMLGEDARRRRAEEMHRTANVYLGRAVVARCNAHYWETMRELCLRNHAVVVSGPADEASNLVAVDFDTVTGLMHQHCERARRATAKEQMRRAFEPMGGVPPYVLEALTDRPPPAAEGRPRSPGPDSEEEEDNGDVRSVEQLVHVRHNQYSLGGPTACTSISFVAAAAMREHGSARDVLLGVQWEKIMRLGVRLWKAWLADHGGNPVAGFQTLEQIRLMPAMNTTFAMLGGAPAEFGGRIDGRPMDPTADPAAYRAAYPGLRDAVRAVAGKGRGAVAVVTIGCMSVSLWSEGTRGLAVLFDSHGTLSAHGQSTVAVCPALDATVATVLRMCGSGAGGLRPRTVGSLDATDTYCMYAFGPK